MRNKSKEGDGEYMKKVLFVATVAIHMRFHIPYLKWFRENGFEVHVAAHCDNERTQYEWDVNINEYCDKIYDIPIYRSPFRLSNIEAYRQLKKIIESEDYTIVHGHTPMGGILARLCTRNQRKKGTKVIYSVHGFHFCKGAPLLNWLLYYPIEKLCARFTDVLITTNNEDFEFAKRKMCAKEICYIPGIGCDTKKFANAIVDIEKRREELGVKQDEVFLLSVGELIKRKNHETIMKAVKKLNNPQIKYFICGDGMLRSYLENLIETLGLSKQVILLGYRKDIDELCKSADIFCFPSYQEGLPIALVGAMASGLPIVASNIRGVVDCVENNTTGLLCNPTDINAFANAIEHLIRNSDTRKQLGDHSKTVVQKFDIKNAMQEMEKIYLDVIGCSHISSKSE